jgi:hypothetical protein
MKNLKTLAGPVLGLLLALSGCGAESEDGSSGPTIALSTQNPVFEEHIDALGEGFTPMSNVTSHLARPDGTSYPELPIMTDENGEFVHDIDTLLMANGTYEWWVVDDVSGATSNVASFEVTRD